MKQKEKTGRKSSKNLSEAFGAEERKSGKKSIGDLSEALKAAEQKKGDGIEKEWKEGEWPSTNTNHEETIM